MKKILFLVFSLTFSLASCDKELTESFDIRFESNGGSLIQDVSVDEGNIVELPEDPTRNEFNFIGWYLNADFSVAFNQDNPISEDLTLFAKWESVVTVLDTYDVYFESNGGSLIESISTYDGTPIAMPDDPVKSGFTFSGWFLNESCSMAFNDSNPITEDLTIYAKWEMIVVTLSDILLQGPGDTPVVFAPGFISTEINTEFAGTFSPDYTYYFYTRRTENGTNRIFYTELNDAVWSDPVLSPVSEDVPESEPFITNDGLEMYFQSRRDNINELTIYKSNFIDGVWDDPELAEKGLNDLFVMYITIADSGNIYFTGLNESNSTGIYVIKYIDGIYEPAVYTGISGTHPYIAPDESYILLDIRVDNSDYIHIVQNSNGIWSTPVQLGEEVNQVGATQICPSVTSDGKYFFFSRFVESKGDIFWVDADYLLDYMS